MTSRGAIAGAIAFTIVASACDRWQTRVSARDRDPWSESGLLSEGARFLEDPTFRRAALVESLTNPNNTYSRERLSNYALGTRGWDLLPEWTPRSGVLSGSIAQALRSGGEVSLEPGTPPLWDGVLPATLSAWVALGREVFFRYPLRKDAFIEWALVHPEMGARMGVRPADDGSYPGIVVFVDTRGAPQVGMTCAMCHADVEQGRLIVGQARRTFDFGALRLAYHSDTRTAVDPDLARRMRTWGPGRADVTEDDDEDPVAIPDLWGLRYEAYLTQAGTIKHTGVSALAIRQETQLLTSNHHTVRPPRALALALALFLYSLKPPATERSLNSGAAERGRGLFVQHCKSCHSNAAGGGDLVPTDEVETDPALANGAARGTGHYRTAPLVRVASAAPYFHNGAIASLQEVLSPSRLESTFAKGMLGTGPVSGHRYGMELTPADRDTLVAYLLTL
jgi:hypothetical protein